MAQESILLVEDEDNVARFIQLELEFEGYYVEVASDGQQGWELSQQKEWDLILLDWMLPKLNGLEVCRRIRKLSEIPIIVLTARDYVGDKIAGLDTGADDYITKPFEIEELLARIRANLRRHNKEKGAANEGIMQLEDLLLDERKRLVFRSENQIELTQREFDLLLYLMQNAGTVLTREQLLSNVWGFDFVGETNVVDVYIRYLRNKLDRDFTPKLIQTVRGIGYVLRSS
ncbi:response regulator transcription factor [Aneurinibacillus tyrosinisolvens]|uniref:response regulator transcription factor n=1 Tax=Aneurinibacillus tyrosinisolvens TaxID=1443435 RepID=UPI00063F7365|nr:response regulator transcription factor [Aneurinibacillus tyrosinisolvens]